LGVATWGGFLMATSGGWAWGCFNAVAGGLLALAFGFVTLFAIVRLFSEPPLSIVTCIPVYLYRLTVKATVITYYPLLSGV
jgi:hypothetical protein